LGTQCPCMYTQSTCCVHAFVRAFVRSCACVRSCAGACAHGCSCRARGCACLCTRLLWTPAAVRDAVARIMWPQLAYCVRGVRAHLRASTMCAPAMRMLCACCAHAVRACDLGDQRDAGPCHTRRTGPAQANQPHPSRGARLRESETTSCARLPHQTRAGDLRAHHMCATPIMCPYAHNMCATPIMCVCAHEHVCALPASQCVLRAHLRARAHVCA
jgi:hypothetical protein